MAIITVRRPQHVRGKTPFAYSTRSSTAIPMSCTRSAPRLLWSSALLTKNLLGGARFAEFEREPVAAASLAQVHRARTHDGQEVRTSLRQVSLNTIVQPGPPSLSLRSIMLRLLHHSPPTFTHCTLPRAGGGQGAIPPASGTMRRRRLHHSVSGRCHAEGMHSSLARARRGAAATVFWKSKHGVSHPSMHWIYADISRFRLSVAGWRVPLESALRTG
jgi:hypothetical protein